MSSPRSIPYRLFCMTRHTPLCEAVLSFSSSQRHGRVSIALTYPDPSAGGAEKRHAQSQSWFENSRGELLMCVGRFSLPDALKRRGLGTWIWSMIYRHLPVEVRSRLILTGSLSATDALVPRTDPEGRPLLGPDGPLLMNQVALRNRFWGRMLSPTETEKPPLWCDEAGNGAFRGRFTDPFSSQPFCRILAEPAQKRAHDLHAPSLCCPLRKPPVPGNQTPDPEDPRSGYVCPSGDTPCHLLESA